METKVKNEKEIAIMKESGKRLGMVLQELLATAAFVAIAKLDASPSFLTVRNYQWATCICVNDTVVHGIPTDTPFQDGDVVTVDVGLIYKELHTDTAWTKVVQSEEFRPKADRPLDDKVQRNVEKFLQIGEKALWAGIAQARGGNHIGDISQTVQQIVEGSGYHIVELLVGHGIGYSLHEYPHVPNVLTRPIKTTPTLLPGMTFAIEVIYTQGLPDIMHMPDGWTIKTVDGSLAAVFEHTVLITQGNPLVLTK